MKELEKKKKDERGKNRGQQESKKNQIKKIDAAIGKVEERRKNKAFEQERGDKEKIRVSSREGKMNEEINKTQ